MNRVWSLGPLFLVLAAAACLAADPAPPSAPPVPVSPMTRDFVVDKAWLRFPVLMKGEPRVILFVVDGKVVRRERVRLADAAPDFTGSVNVEEFRGKTVTLRTALPSGSQGLSGIVLADTRSDDPDAYHEAYRPQFHFTAARGWMNDPNGMVYSQGEYHLFFQHTPTDIHKASNMHWGHAVSADMVHWKELADAFYPTEAGGEIYSGSAVVDRNNTAGLPGEGEILAAFYTLAGKFPFGQCLAFSRDRGRSWSQEPSNPVVPELAPLNRDPKVIWYEPAKRWIMVLYLEKNDFAFLSSPDLRTWTRQQTFTFPDSMECPDFFPLPIEGESGRKWILTSAKSRYLVGEFDGATFTPDDLVPRRSDWGINFYAPQTFSDMPDGRRVQMAWMALANNCYPGMPFVGQMTFPTTLTLHRFPDGLALVRWPVAEIESLWGEDHAWTDLTVLSGTNPLAALPWSSYDISVEFEVPAASASASSGEFGFTFKGLAVVYSPANKTLTVQGKTAPLEPEDGRIRLRLLVDKTSVEVYGNDGRVSFGSCIDPGKDGPALELFSRSGPVRVAALHVRDVHSIWP